MKLKKVVTGGLALTLAAASLVGCGGSKSSASTTAAATTAAAASATTAAAAETTAAGSKEDNIEKPDKITIMVDGTVTTQANNQEAFKKRWEELTGIQLEIIQPDHDAYYDQLQQTLASGSENWPDAFICSADYYSSYAEEGVLADLTDLWDNSDLKASGRVSESGQSVIDNIKIDGKLYGFPVTRGNGCVTYVKKKWLDNCGISAPTTYDEYLDMLDKFTTGDPDGDGTNGNTYGTSAAGLIGKEAPYTNYLPEFYQGAYPSFQRAEDGTYHDAFMDDSFKEALTRLQDAYSKGYIDKESLTNGTKDCRNKYYEDQFGAFTYWAGTWASNIKNNLQSNGKDDELVALKPIAELGNYVERIPPVWCITSSCKNPDGVWKYLIESMLDDGDTQILWQYGVEDVHWSTKAETIDIGADGDPSNDVTYADGEWHQKESIEKPGTQYTKQHIDPMLCIAPMTNDPGLESVAPEAKEAQEMFNSNCVEAQLIPTTDVMASENGDLTTLKQQLVASVVVEGQSYDDAFAKFEADGGVKMSQDIVDSLNNK